MKSPSVPPAPTVPEEVRERDDGFNVDMPTKQEPSTGIGRELVVMRLMSWYKGEKKVGIAKATGTLTVYTDRLEFKRQLGNAAAALMPIVFVKEVRPIISTAAVSAAALRGNMTRSIERCGAPRAAVSPGRAGSFKQRSSSGSRTCKHVRDPRFFAYSRQMRPQVSRSSSTGVMTRSCASKRSGASMQLKRCSTDSSISSFLRESRVVRRIWGYAA